jgi:hypothetical protein
MNRFYNKNILIIDYFHIREIPIKHWGLSLHRIFSSQYICCITKKLDY